MGPADRIRLARSPLIPEASRPTPGRTPIPSAGTLLRRGTGLALLLLASLPIYRLLLIGDTGLAGRATVATADAQAIFLWTGFLLVLGVGAAAGVLLPTGSIAGPVERAQRVLETPQATVIALIAGVLGAGLSALFSALVMEHRPPMMDPLVQLLHARYVAAGALAATPDLWGPHWHVQNSVLTDVGWVSHYPPGHVVLLGVGFFLGAVWMLGPALMGVTAFFSVLIGDHLFPRNRALGRFGGVIVAFSPLLLAHSGSFMRTTPPPPPPARQRSTSGFDPGRERAPGHGRRGPEQPWPPRSPPVPWPGSSSRPWSSVDSGFTGRTRV